jgi:hypothetical protein
VVVDNAAVEVDAARRDDTGALVDGVGVVQQRPESAEDTERAVP